MRITFTYIAAACFILATCSKDYNPFEDKLNAEAHVSWASFEDGDTIDVFCSETLLVSVAARELIEKITVGCFATRTFVDDTTVSADSSAYAFYLSFYDTGNHTIEIVTTREGGENVTTAFSLYVRSPLSQSPITGNFDDPIHLSTAPVGDDDVLYHWDFGKGSPFESPYPDTHVVILEVGPSDTGWLWVTDLHGKHASPKQHFSYSLKDSIAPQVVCMNEGFEGKDTIKTGDATFFFKVQITDRGQGGVLLARIDGGPFDIDEDPLFVKIFHQMDTLHSVKKVTVNAVDNGKDYNEATRSFYLQYDSTIAGSGENIDLFVKIPSHDSTVSHTRKRFVYGIVENYRRDSLRLSLNVNDSSYTSLTIGNTFSSEWAWEVLLDQPTNSVTITARDLGGSLIEDTTFTMLYDSTAADASPPIILEVSVEGIPAHGLYVETDTVTLQIVAFDEGSGLSSLTVQGKSSVAGQTLGDYLWRVPVELNHSIMGTIIEISAVDGARHQKDTTVTIYQNRAPQISSMPTPPDPVFAASRYRDTISAHDPDGDLVLYNLVSAPPGLSLNGLSGIIQWTPTAADTGTWEIKISVTDQREPQVVDFKIRVLDSASFGSPVEFQTTEQDFPAFVEAGSDTIRVVLDISGGVAPYSYNAVRRVGSTGKDIAMVDSVFQWAPDTADTGYQHFTITVTDEYGRVDTLFPSVEVVAPNRPCSLQVSFALDTLPDGSLDFSNSTQPETLTFHIVDPDPPSSERYTVTIGLGGRQDIRTIQGADTFLVIVDPYNISASGDSVSVFIVDRGGHTDSLIVRLSP